MNKYSKLVFAGILLLWPTLAAPAQERIQIVVGEQGGSTLTPDQGQVQYDPGPDPNAAPRVVHGPFDEGGHFLAGAGLYIVKPYFQNNPAFFSQTFTSIGGPGTFTSEISTTQHDFCWDLNATPVVWLGYVSECGLGVRARWWLFDQESAACALSDSNTTIISAAPGGLTIRTLQPGSEMFVKSNLKLDVWDFEAIQQIEAGRWLLMPFAGVRYAHLSQDYGAFAPSVGLNALESSHLSSGHNFNGAGPTVGLEVKRFLGNSRVSLYGSLRGAILFGDAKSEVDEETIARFTIGPRGPFVIVTNSGSDRDTVLPVVELEMGVEYSRTCGRVHPFLRTGLVAQTWFDAGSASSLDGNLGFLGLSVTAGLNY